MAKQAAKKTGGKATSGKAAKKRYEVLVPYDYEHKGEMKTAWTRVGAAFESADGEGFNIELRPGLAVNGRIVVRPAKASDDEQGGDHPHRPFTGPDANGSREDLI